MSGAPFPHHDRPLAAGLSHVGVVRQRNEDRLTVPDEDASVDSLDHYGRLFAVADGMGGHSGGDVASQTVMDTLIGTFYAASTDDVFTRLQRAVDAANEAVVARAAADPILADMGATLTAVVLYGQSPCTATLAHIGDSRAYLIRDGGIQQISEEHTFIAEALRTHTLTEAEAAVHPNRHAITRAMGRAGGIQAYYGQMDLRPGDRLILCSDGLTNVVTDYELLQTALAHPPDEAAQHLVDLANERGGPDNVTVVVVAMPGAAISAPVPVPSDADRTAPTVVLQPMPIGPGGAGTGPSMGPPMWYDGPGGGAPSVVPSALGRRALAMRLGGIAAVSLAVVGLFVATSLFADQEINKAQQDERKARNNAATATAQLATAVAADDPIAVAMAVETSKAAEVAEANARATLVVVRATASAPVKAPQPPPTTGASVAPAIGPEIRLRHPVSVVVTECSVHFAWEFIGVPPNLDTSSVSIVFCRNGDPTDPSDKNCQRAPAAGDGRSFDLDWESRGGEHAWRVESQVPRLRSEVARFKWEANNCEAGDTSSNRSDDKDGRSRPTDTPVPTDPPTAVPSTKVPPPDEPTEPPRPTDPVSNTLRVDVVSRSSLDAQP